MPRIPSDLIPPILELLGEGSNSATNDLRAASLVSWAWAASARPLLFEHVTVQSNLSEIATPTRKEPSIHQLNPYHVVYLMLHPDLAFYIRSILIKVQSKVGILFPFLSHLPDFFPNVTILRFTNLAFARLAFPTVSFLMAGWPQVQNLILEVPCPTKRHYRILGASPDVGPRYDRNHLDTRGVFLNTERNHELSFVPVLARLNIRGDPITVEAILETMSAPMLRSMRVSVHADEQNAEHGPALRLLLSALNSVDRYPCLHALDLVFTSEYTSGIQKLGQTADLTGLSLPTVTHLAIYLEATTALPFLRVLIPNIELPSLKSFELTIGPGFLKTFTVPDQDNSGEPREVLRYTPFDQRKVGAREAEQDGAVISDDVLQHLEELIITFEADKLVEVRWGEEFMELFTGIDKPSGLKVVMNNFVLVE